jgi:hypothetical protein
MSLSRNRHWLCRNAAFQPKGWSGRSPEGISPLGTGDEGLAFRSVFDLPGLPLPSGVDVVRAVCDSGYPARGTLEDFRVLVAEPILGAPPRLRTARNASARDPRRPKRRELIRHMRPLNR